MMQTRDTRRARNRNKRCIICRREFYDASPGNKRKYAPDCDCAARANLDRANERYYRLRVTSVH